MMLGVLFCGLFYVASSMHNKVGVNGGDFMLKW